MSAGMARQARPGVAGHGRVRQGTLRRGTAGMASHGLLGRVMARQAGGAKRGKLWPGMARRVEVTP